MPTTFKKFSSTPSVSTMADTDILMAQTAAGASKRLSWASLKSLVNAALTPASATATAAEACDPVMIAMAGPVDSAIRYDKIENWPSRKNAGYTAIGVLVSDGECRVIVALDEADSAGLLWSSAAGDIPGLTNYTSGQKAKMLAESTDGAANTAAILAASSASMITNTTDYAAGFCNAYSKTAPWDNGKSGSEHQSGTAGIPAGKWHLPSMRELWAIHAHLNAVNRALLLAGGTKIPLATHWSSTESSAAIAWSLGFSAGVLYCGSKTTNRPRVRPCAAFL